MIKKNENKVELRDLEPTDWPEVRAIYEEGIATGVATFESDIPEWNKWDGDHLPHSRKVALVEEKIVGWIALSPVSGRCAYQGVGEVSIYISHHAKGQNVGKALIDAVINSSEENGIWTLYSVMMASNQASIRFHEKNGFRRVGYREKIARLNGEWHDTIIFERRSPNIK